MAGTSSHLSRSHTCFGLECLSELHLERLGFECRQQIGINGEVAAEFKSLTSQSRLSGSALATYLLQQANLMPPSKVPALVVGDLIQLLASNLNQNRIFVPTMSVLSVLADAGVLEIFATSTDVHQK